MKLVPPLPPTARGCFRSSGEGLDVNFGAAFGGAHDAGGVDGFVGGDHDEVFDAVGGGGVGEGLGAEDVVSDGFAGVGFGERDVFVCGGVEDDGGEMIGEDLVDADGVGNVADSGDEFDGGEGFFEFAFDFEDGVFGLVEEDEEGGFKAADGAAEFAADAAAGTADEDDLCVD